MQTTTIKVAAIINSHIASTPEQGQKLYEQIHSLSKQSPVEVDFTGVRIMISVFLNFALGQLVKDRDTNKIYLTGLTQHQRKQVKVILENAKNYYATHPEKVAYPIIEFELV